MMFSSHLRSGGHTADTSQTGLSPYLCDEVGVRQEELFNDVKKRENRSQLVLKSQFGFLGDRWRLLVSAADAVDLFVNTGRAGLKVR